MVESGGELFDAVVTPKAIKNGGQTYGQIGVTPVIDRAAADALVVNVRYNAVDSAVKAVVKVWDMSIFSLK